MEKRIEILKRRIRRVENRMSENQGNCCEVGTRGYFDIEQAEDELRELHYAIHELMN